MMQLRQAPATTRETSLQSEASIVERLRRQIAEMPARGEVATPQLLAEFARAQKAYLDKKIEFEKQRRNLAEGKGGSAVRPLPSTTPAVPAAFPDQKSTPKESAATSKPGSPASARNRVIAYWVLAALAVGALLWFVATRW